MALTKYDFTISTDTANGVVDTSNLKQEIVDNSNITIAPERIDTAGDAMEVWMKDAIDAGQQTELTSTVNAHTGISSSPPAGKVDVVSGKIHQSSMEKGMTTYFSGCGDDVTDASNVGDGSTCMYIDHQVGGAATEKVTLEYNCIDNMTKLHEGYVNWEGFVGDKVSLSVVTRAYNPPAGTSTNFKAIPSAPYLMQQTAGDGDLDASLVDLEAPDGGLVYMPLDVFGNRAASFWDADFNSTTGKFENITFNGAGTGRFNVFLIETTLSRFVNKVPFIGSGFMQMQTSDASEIGHGMFLRLSVDLNGADHAYKISSLATLHRVKTY